MTNEETTEAAQRAFVQGVEKGAAAAAHAAAQEADTPIPLSSGARRLVTSSKVILGGLAIVGVITMNVLGKISGELALYAALGIISFVTGANTLEDVVEKIRKGRAEQTAPLMDRIGPLLSAIAPILQAVARAQQPVTAPVPPADEETPRDRDTPQA